MTTPFLYCMLDLILNYFVPPATIDEGDIWDPNTQMGKDHIDGMIDYAKKLSNPPAPPIDPFDSHMRDEDDEDPNYGEEWKNNL